MSTNANDLKIFLKATDLFIRLLASEPNFQGTAWQNEVYVEVRWPWLAFLAAQVVICIVCLTLVIMETAKTDMDVVKSSTIAALFAMSAEEKTDLQRRLTEGEHMMSKEDDLRLAPESIRGQLRKRQGKWAVGGF